LNGTLDFLSVVAALIAQALRYEQDARGAEKLEGATLTQAVEIPHKADVGSLIGTSSAILMVLEQALQVAQTKTTALIRGESGTGKELIAELIHRNSTRARGPFIKV